MANALPAFAVFANDELQIISTTKEQARKEMKDLRKMDCEGVKCFHIEGERPEDAADYMSDEILHMGKSPGPATLQKIATKFNVTIRKI